MPRRRSDVAPLVTLEGGVVRVILVVTGLVLGGVLGLFLGMVGAEVVVNASGPLDESEYIGIKVLVPLATAALAAVAGGVAGARYVRR